MARRPQGRRCTRFRIGRVSLYLHHQAWWIYYREQGQQVRRRIGTDKCEAERVASEINAQVTSQIPTVFGFVPTTIPDLVEKFLDHHEVVQRSSVATVSRYRTASRHLIDYAAGVGSPAAHLIPPSGFAAFLRQRLVSPNGHANSAKRTLRDKGTQFVLEVARSIYTFAARERHLPPYAPNPFAQLKLDRFVVEDAKPIFLFDEATEGQFLKAARDWEFAVHFTLAKSGLRPGELCHLLIEDLDLDDGWLLVRGKPAAGWKVKTRRDRAVPLLPEVCELLRRTIGGRCAGPVFRRPLYKPVPALASPSLNELEVAYRQRLAAARGNSTVTLTRAAEQKIAVQLWRDAGAFDPDQIRRSFLRVAARCELTEATCVKSWRHTFATLLQDANVDPLIRQITLGHKPTNGGELGMTAVYTHSRRETQAREIARALSAWPSSLQLARTRALGGAHHDP